MPKPTSSSEPGIKTGSDPSRGPPTWAGFRPDAGIARPPGCKTYVTRRACLALGRWMVVVQLKAFVQPNVRVGILPQKTRLRVDGGTLW